MTDCFTITFISALFRTWTVGKAYSLLFLGECESKLNLFQIGHEVSLTGPSSVVPNSTLIFTFSAALDYVNPKLVFSARLTGVEGLATLLSARVVHAGIHWGSLNPAPHHSRFPTDPPTSFPRGTGFSRLTLPLGYHANARARDLNAYDPTNGSIQIELSLHVLSPPGPKLHLEAFLEVNDGTVFLNASTNFTVVANRSSYFSEPDPGFPPTFSLERVSGPELRNGDLVTSQLTMRVPKDTEAEYSLQVHMPTTDAGLLVSGCGIRVTHSGFHVPFHRWPGILSRVHRYSPPGDAYSVQRLQLSLGRIRNTGLWSGDEDRDEDNEIRFSLSYQVLRLPAVGDSAEVTVSMIYGDQELNLTDVLTTTHEASGAEAGKLNLICQEEASPTAVAGDSFSFRGTLDPGTTTEAEMQLRLSVSGAAGLADVCGRPQLSLADDVTTAAIHLYPAVNSTHSALLPVADMHTPEFDSNVGPVVQIPVSVCKANFSVPIGDVRLGSKQVGREFPG